MSEGKFMCLMFSIIQNLCDKIKKHYNITYEEALDLLYNSELYALLEIEETKMWYFSNYALFDMFLNEQKTGKLTVYGG